MNDKKLWKTFSEYIRRRDADENGFCKCFTCGFRAHWKRFDAGHGIPIQYWSVRYNEKNVHAQCKRCNGFEGGKREEYKIQMNKKYGPNTWELMELSSKKASRWTQFEVDALHKYYLQKLREMK